MAKVLSKLANPSAPVSIAPTLSIVKPITAAVSNDAANQDAPRRKLSDFIYDRRAAFAFKIAIKAGLNEKSLGMREGLEKLTNSVRQSEAIFDALYPNGLGNNHNGERDQEALSQILATLLEYGDSDFSDIRPLINLLKSNSADSALKPHLSQLYLVAKNAYPTFKSDEAGEVDALKLSAVKSILPLQQIAMKFSFWHDEVRSAENLQTLCAQTVDAVKKVSDARGIDNLMMKQSLIGKAFSVATEAYKKSANEAIKIINNEPNAVAKSEAKTKIGLQYLASIHETVLIELNRLLDLTESSVAVLFPQAEQGSTQTLMQG